MGVEARGWQGAEEGAYPWYATDEQRRQTGWIGVPNCEVILARALGVCLTAWVLLAGPASAVVQRTASVPAPNEDGLEARLKFRECTRAVREEAARLCREALEMRLSTRRAAVVNEVLGRALAGLERWDEALTAYQEVLRLRPDDPFALFQVGMALLHGLDRAQQAEPYLRQAAQARPEDAAYAVEWAVCLNVLGRHDEALAAFKAALAVDADCLAHRPAARTAYEAAAKGVPWP